MKGRHRESVRCNDCGAVFPEIDKCGHPSVVAAMTSAIRNALDNACHGREGFAYRQLAAAIGASDDPDYLAFIEAQDARERKKREKKR